VRHGQAGERDQQADAVEHEEEDVLPPQRRAAAVPEGPQSVAGVGHRRRDDRRHGLGRERLVGRVQDEVEDADVDDVGDPADDAELHQLADEGVQPVVGAQQRVHAAAGRSALRGLTGPA
jgi:hypothetical protein